MPTPPLRGDAATQHSDEQSEHAALEQTQYNWDRVADRVLSGESITREEALAVLNTDSLELPHLLAAAYRIRYCHFGNRVRLNYLINAKSGRCPEDCHYCSQSKISSAEIDRYSLQSVDEIVNGARRAASVNAATTCIVLSGRGPNRLEMDRVTEAVQRIKAEHPTMKVCACMGLLDEGQADRLKDAGVDRYNHNLNTSDSHYENICATHSYGDRIDTVRESLRAGMRSCSGVIVGMGETCYDLVDVAMELRALGAYSIPVNFLIRFQGTPLGDPDRAVGSLTPHYCLNVLCMFRMVCPQAEIRVSAGREEHLRTLQPMSLYPANSWFVSDYLTTSGQSPKLDEQIIRDMGMQIESSVSDSEHRPCDCAESKCTSMPGKS